MITKNVKLYLGDGFPVRIPVSQYDTMWRFVFTIINNSQPWQIPTGATAVLNGRKPDGNVFAFSGTIENNTVTVDADVQMTAVAGQTVCELSILADGKTVGTANFTLAVESAPNSTGETPSASDVDAYGAIVSGELDTYFEQHPEMIEGKGLSEPIRMAILNCFRHVAWVDEHGSDYYNTLYNLLMNKEVLSITSVFEQGSAVIYDTDALDTLRQYLTVTALYDDGTSGVVTGYELSGTLEVGTSTVTVTYGGKTDTFTATVTWGYKLRNAFSSTGETAVDTGIVLESDNTYTIKGDFTLTGINTSTSNHTADFIFANKIANNSTYIGLQVIKESWGAKHNYMWGAGIGYSAGDGLAVLNNQYRFVLTIDVANLSCSITLKNVTSGVANTYTNTYAADAFANGKAIFLGNGEGGSVNTGFIGTISDFEIALGAMSSSDISDYLAG